MLRRLMGQLCLFALGCSFLDPFTPLARASEAPILLIGEVAWAGSSLSSADEWLELWNLGDTPLDLSGYRLEGASASSIVFDQVHVIAPQSAFLIANYDASDEKSSIATTTHLVSTAVSLSNSTLSLRLFDANDVLVDELASGTPPAGSSSPKATMIRSALDMAWLSATTTNFMKTDITDLGTPGFCDGCHQSLVPLVEIPEVDTETDSEAELEDAIIPEEQFTEPTEIESSESPTSTPVVTTDDNEEVIETTEELSPEETTTTETIIQSSEPTLVQTADPAPVTTPTPTALITPPPGLAMQAIFPAPDNAYEWIKLGWTNETHELSRLDGWFIQNGRDKVIFRFSTSTRPNLVEENSLVQVTFKSAVLLNAGDTISLYNASGALVDRVSYPETIKGSTWTLDGEWKNDHEVPVVPSEPTTSTITEATETNLTPIPTITTSTLVEIAPMTTTPKTTTIKRTASKTTTPKTTAAKTTTAAKKTTTKTATPSKTALANSIYPSTIEQILMQPQSLRVRVQGVVGTVPGILLKRQFILQAPDGRGLLVKVPTGQKTPTFGATVELTGTITDDDDGIILTMKTQDTWTILSSDPVIIPSRVIDVLAEEAEDAWSKMSVTGTILSISAGKAEVDVDGIHLTVLVKAATRYRVQRLKKGDLIHVTGVLSFTKDGPTLYPITAEDITILKSAEQAQAGQQKASLPDWVPFGAAGVTVAAYESLKRWRKRKPLNKQIVTIT